MATLTVSDLLKSLASGVPSWMWFLLALVVAYQVSQGLFGAKIKGWLGEKLVARSLARLEATKYESLHDLYLPRPDGEGTTQLDHVVVSPFGIFVIETKNYKGWIFGTEKQRQWTQSIYKSKHRFQNPLHQNALHVRALAKFLGLKSDQLHSVIYFVGDSTFKTEIPKNVLDRGLRSHIESHSTPLLDPTTVERVQERLAELDQGTNRKEAARQHLKHLRAKERKRPAKAG